MTAWHGAVPGREVGIDLAAAEEHVEWTPTAKDHAREVLVADGFSPSEADWWLGREGERGSLLHYFRIRRARALERSGLVETPSSEHAGQMVRALLAVASEAQRGQGML